MDNNENSFVIPVREDETYWGWLTPYLDTVLEDDCSDYGGTAFAGETLGDFLLGSNLSDTDVYCMYELNTILKENGIKPIGES